MPVVIVVCGVSGAGKSTVGTLLAARLGRDFYDADDFHPPANVEKMRRGEPLTDDDRAPWLDALRGLIERCVRERQPAVLACSALKAAHRDRLGIDQRRVHSVFLRGSQDLIAERLARREHAFMPPSLLRSQFEALEPPMGGIHVDVDAAPEAIVERIVATLDGQSTRA
jgi:gluconokinase